MCNSLQIDNCAVVKQIVRIHYNISTIHRIVFYNRLANNAGYDS